MLTISLLRLIVLIRVRLTNGSIAFTDYKICWECGYCDVITRIHLLHIMPKNKYLNGSLFSKRPLAPSEATVSQSIESYLDARRLFHLRLNSGKIKVGSSVIHLCPAGTPDRFCLYRGFCVFIEVKAFGKKPSPEQIAAHARIRQSGGIVVTAYSIDDVRKTFSEIDLRSDAAAIS